MKLLNIDTRSYLDFDIFNEEEGFESTKKEVFVIVYKDNEGNECEKVTKSVLYMTYFIKWIYEGKGFQDITEDPRSPEFFQDFMRGDLVNQR